MTKVIRFHQYGGPDVLKIEDIEVLAPGPGEVQICVRAIGLNRADALMRRGTYIETPELPSGLGLEAAGIIERIGEGVVDLVVGDTVSVVPPVSMSRWPAYGEIATFPAFLIVKHPSTLSFEAAAAIWMAYLTAYGALVDVANLKAYEVVAITAASSSVGLAAIQIANRLGAVPIAITRNSTKRQALLEAGAAHVIVSAEEDIETKLRAMTQAQGGVRVVLDPVGGPLFDPLTAAMSKGGILIEYGGLSNQPTPFPLFNVLSKSLTLRGYLVHEVVTNPIRLAAAKEFILAGLADGVFRPIISRTFSFGEIVDAHRFLESNEQFGKIVITR
jgi:NADPH:quinone reductase-like Zn-dependent oxidoreductase